MIGEKAAVISLAVGGSVLFYAGVFVWLTSEFSTRNLLMLLAGAAMLALAVVLFLRSGNKKSGKSSTANVRIPTLCYLKDVQCVGSWEKVQLLIGLFIRNRCLIQYAGSSQVKPA